MLAMTSAIGALNKKEAEARLRHSAKLGAGHGPC